MLGQACAERVCPGNDDAVINAHFEERIADCADFLAKVLMRNSNLAVLVAALFLVGNLIFDLQRASTRLDHLFSEQIRCLGIAKASINVGDDRNNMRFVIVDSVLNPLGFNRIAIFAGSVELAEQAAKLAGIGLLQEGVKLLDQRWNAGFLMHGLIGQGAKFATQCGNHPARQIKVTLLGRTKMLLDRDHLLLSDKPVPATQRLGVGGRVCIIGSHIFAHDSSCVFSNVEASAEAVLDFHPCCCFWVDCGPCLAIAANGFGEAVDGVLISHANCLSNLMSAGKNQFAPVRRGVISASQLFALAHV